MWVCLAVSLARLFCSSPLCCIDASSRFYLCYSRASVLCEAADLHSLDIMELGKPLQSLIRSWNIALQGLIQAFAGLAPLAAVLDGASLRRRWKFESTLESCNAARRQQERSERSPSFSFILKPLRAQQYLEGFLFWGCSYSLQLNTSRSSKSKCTFSSFYTALECETTILSKIQSKTTLPRCPFWSRKELL